MWRRPATAALLVAAGLLASCGKRDDPCSNAVLNRATADLVSSWYLYPDLLPPTIDPGAYPDPTTLLDALTANARAQGKDRYWSYTTTLAAAQSFFDAGTTVGFGVGVLVRGSQLFVGQTYPGSAAANGGFLRGDEIVAIGEADPLTPVSTLIANDAACAAADPSASCSSLGDAFGPATVGIQRLFDVIPRGQSATVRRALIKTAYGLDPVPTPPAAPADTILMPSGALVIDRTAQSLPKAGYVALRSFISPADDRLSAVFADFLAQGVQDVVVDLRYNGGGLLTTADLLVNLLGAGLEGTTELEIGYNSFHPFENFNYTFGPVTGAIAPLHVAFLVTGATASASELVPNALAPWRPVVLVGHQTYGKPVGQRAFANYQCGFVVYLISLRISNGKGFGGYYQGLPTTGFDGCGVSADDDLTHDTWDPSETQTAAALQWLADQAAGPSCAAYSTPLSVSGAVRPADVYPEPTRPTDAQRHVRGLF